MLFPLGSSINVHYSILQKENSGVEPHVSSSCILCRGRHLLPAAPYSRRSAFSGCLLPINQPLTLDASQLFEHHSGPMYIALLQKSCPSQRRQIYSSLYINHPYSLAFAFNILFCINLLYEFWLIELPFVSRIAS